MPYSSDLELFCKALDVPLFDIGILDHDIMNVFWSKTMTQVLKRQSYLAYRNIHNAHIFIRPAQSWGTVLLDDLTTESIDSLIQHRFLPAAIIETSPKNHQVWLRFSQANRTWPRSQIHYCLQSLTERFNADPSSADWRHFGRAVAFTNRKPEHQDPQTGYFPWVNLVEASGVLVPNGTQILESYPVKNIKTVPQTTIRQNPHPRDGLYLRLFREQAKKHPRSANDKSSIDFLITCKLYRQGWKTEQIQSVLLQRPDIHFKKHGHVSDYLHRTCQRAADLTGRIY